MYPSGLLEFFIYPGGPVSISSSTAYNDGLPHHVVGSLSSSGQFFYIDGQLIGSTPTTNAQIYGGFWNVGGSGNRNSLEGAIDEVAIYNSALSATRIQAHYLAGSENCISQTSLASNAWNHLAGVFNNLGNTASLYLNGNQQCSIPLSGMNYSGSSNDLTAGSSPSQTSFWSGAIASIKTYASALTSSLIQQNYAATAATFDVQQLGAPAPIMWLRADSIQGLSDGAQVDTWPDSSGNGNHATQGTVGNQPVWKNNILNGYPVVRLNGTSSFMNGPSVFPVNSDYTVIIASVPRSLSSPSSALLGTATAPWRYVIFHGNQLWLYHDSTSFSAGFLQYATVGSEAIFTAVFDNSALEASYFYNGLTAGAGTTTNLNTNNQIEIGAVATNQDFFNGDIAEILLFGFALSDNDRSLIETYLNAKYGIY